jgi:glycosyltransferase involved in cell wall biosynthesis
VTVGSFSPLPPARTGVADYAAALLKALRARAAVEIDKTDADICIYHVGNNHLHREIYRRALERPGLVVLHDAVLQHFFLGSLTEREYIDEFVYNYGSWSEDQARWMWRDRARSAADPRYFEYPMLKRIAGRSLGVVVHNPAAAAMVLAHARDAVVFSIPHLFEPPELPTEYEIERFRKQQLGLTAAQCLIGVFGHLRESKRLPSILRAFERARRECDLRLLVAGDFASTDLERSLAPWLQADGIIRVGYTPDRDFWRYASAVDACVNLRSPAAGETSGIAVRLMGIGKPVLVTETLENSEFPKDACIRVEGGIAEEDMLAQVFTWIARFPEDAREIGRRGAEYIRECHAPDRVAALYWAALETCYHEIKGRIQAG